MILSIFIRDKELHISTPDFARIQKVSRTCAMAETIAGLFGEVMLRQRINDISEIIYSSGPASYTTTRIMTSVIKGFQVVKPEITPAGILTFSTYLSMLPEDKEGFIAIPSMRGVYYVAKFERHKILSINEFKDLPPKTYSIDDEIFQAENLAIRQYKTYKNQILNQGNSLVKNDFFLTNFFYEQNSR